ncbi:MAG: hypothetical protein U1B80_04825 [Anaerolineaceae bacterium]|nr:hypothetical protein [Anaerolineaceae bacterium]
MKKATLQKILALLALALVMLACGLPGIGKEKNGDTQTASSTQYNDSLGNTYRSQKGGYAFQGAPGYDLEENSGIVYMSASDADPDAGPMLLMIGGINIEEKTAEDLVEDFKRGLANDQKISKQRSVSIAGKSGVAVDYESSNHGIKIVGQAVFVAVTPTQIFSMIGIFPADQYGSKEKDLFTAISKTVSFFDPNAMEAADNSGEIVTPGLTQADQPGAPAKPSAGAVPQSASGRWKFYTTADGLADPIIRALAVAPDGTVWIGNGNQGISRFKSGTFTHFSKADGLGANNGNGIAVAPDGTVWAATNWGLAKFDGSRWTNYLTDQGLLSNDVKSVAIAPDGSIWAGVSSGASHFDGKNWKNYTPSDGLGEKPVLDIAFDSQGGVWFTSPNGISYFKDGSWKVYNQEDGLSYKYVTSVIVAPDEAVWFATAGQGACRFDGSAWKVYRKDEGLSFNTKDIVVAADGSLWFATSGDGVFRFNGASFEKWSTADGLPSDWVDLIAAAPDGSIWVGFRDGGIARFGE